MKRLIEELENRKMELENHIYEAEKYLADAPEGVLILSRSNRTDQYYRLTKSGKKYISKKEQQLLHDLAQKEYFQEYLKTAKKELVQIEELLQNYTAMQVNIKNGLTEKDSRMLGGGKKNRRRAVIQKYIAPFEISDEEYLRSWTEVQYQKKEIDVASEDAIITEKEEIVRSKSEKIIADKLFSMNVAYHYEKPLFLEPVGYIYPDFTVLNLAERKEYYWEHFGMMDQPEYCVSAIRKMETYIRNNYYPGRNVIFTFETREHPLNVRSVEKQIRKYLLS
ncbi:MAG: hypothetical protein Q4B01_02315 [Eubacteriales bacterium]|nr:hypothetical protein [Eubacteriales bacterium]